MNSWRQRLLELEVERVETCCLCGQEGNEDLRFSRLLALPELKFGVLACYVCELRWLSPRPTLASCRDLYSDEVYFGGEGASPASYSKVASARVSYFKHRIRSLERDPQAKLTLLDYGAATGEFVAMARERGHACQGVELSIDARRHAQERYGIVLLDDEAARLLPISSFDVIHMNHVLEHMADPVAHLRWCRSLLRPGGRVILEVPQQFDNALDLAKRLLRFGGKQARFDAYSLHHTYFFNCKSLSQLLKAAGLNPIKLRTFNYARSPLWPPSIVNTVLCSFLWAADKLAHAGNIIEATAEPD